MHCPKCGQQQVSDETRFCSRCGLLLTGIAEVLANDGVLTPQKIPFTGSPESRKRRGVKQGAFLFMLTFLIVPILIMISIAANFEPFLPVIGMFLFGVGGLIRIAYALMFESGAPTNAFLPGGQQLPGRMDDRGSLPPATSVPASAYTSPAAGSWRDTNDLQAQPGSVTDSTTKLLQKEEERNQ